MPVCTTSTETLKTQLNSRCTHNTHRLTDEDSSPNKAERAAKFKLKVSLPGVEFQRGSGRLEGLGHGLQIRVGACMAP